MRRLAPLLLAAGAVLAQRPDKGPSPRPDPIRESALREIVPLSSGLREDDHPSAASGKTGLWVAWVSYSEADHSTQIQARSLVGGRWSEPVLVSETPGDYSKPAVAVDAAGAVWVAWPAQARGRWDIYGRVLRKTWSKTERWTTGDASNFAPHLAASPDGVLLVWQGMRRGNLDILYRLHDGKAWGREGAVTDNPANDWEPTVIAAPDGAFHVAWDSYRGDYDVFVRTLRRGVWGTEQAVAASPRLENRPALAVDARNRLWIAWEAGPDRWAQDSADGGLRPRRDIQMACLDGGKLFRASEAETALGPIAGQTGLQAPSLAFESAGRLCLFFRRPINTNWLKVGMTAWDGASWSAPQILPNSEGRIDQRIALARTDGRIVACYPAGSSHNILYARSYAAGASTETPKLAEAAALSAKSAPPRPARHTLNSYQLVWGDLHRHTDISEDAGIIDGSLLDTMRYSLDAAGLDFIGITDHTRYLPRRYNLWRIQQISDLFYQPGAFVPLHAYERSQYSPWGHRNVVHLSRDYMPVPAGYELGDAGVSPFGLFAALRGKNAMSIPHTSAWANKQVSWDYNDPDIERVVEIYQGLRSTYEYNGAPDPAGRAVYETDSSNFVWNALERKLKLGFIASSDHRSTHMSFAAVYARNLDRESIFEGLRARRTYAATDRILLDFSIGGRLMGEETAVDAPPELALAVEGTAAIAQIDIIKNAKIVYTANPGRQKVSLTYRDQDWTGQDSYYYARVIQADKNMAWASPIWVRKRP
ncbi:MAG: hypothetical protein HYR60_19425 [Acidobacteria bacterium]|nr:hypothetical protein [Acidobacteriota bacterium]